MQSVREEHSQVPEPRTTVGVVSIGEMGLGVANLLIACGFRVVSCLSDRSPRTRARARGASVELLPTVKAVVQQSDFILSIVPPGVALRTAADFSEACTEINPDLLPEAYLDLNAVSPLTARAVPKLFQGTPTVHVLDGGIIGGPPIAPQADGSSSADPSDPTAWKRPSIVLSGTEPLASLSPRASVLTHALNTRHVGDKFGAASGLKMCFASLTKGFTALATQSFTTASALGVLPELKDHLREFAPGLEPRAERGLVGMVPKAYRWVDEMNQIAETMEEFGGFGHSRDETMGACGRNIYREIGQLFLLVSECTALAGDGQGREQARSADEVATMCGKALRPPKHL